MGDHRSVAAVTGAAACVGLTFLAGCPTVDLGDTPTEIGLCNPAGGVQYFQDKIWPQFIVRTDPNTSCIKNGCHVAGGNGLDFPMPVDYSAAYKRTQIYLNCGTPEASLLLTKPLAGIDPHGGDDIFPNMSDPAVQIFLAWFK
jgi:hypothetical protein